jgi:hypothetical protein
VRSFSDEKAPSQAYSHCARAASTTVPACPAVATLSEIGVASPPERVLPCRSACLHAMELSAPGSVFDSEISREGIQRSSHIGTQKAQRAESARIGNLPRYCTVHRTPKLALDSKAPVGASRGPWQVPWRAEVRLPTGPAADLHSAITACACCPRMCIEAKAGAAGNGCPAHCVFPNDFTSFRKRLGGQGRRLLFEKEK